MPVTASRRCEARLAVERAGGRSIVACVLPAGPLRLLAPVGGGHAAWVYQSSLGGGFVGGDQLSLDVEVAPGAALYLSSQASSRVYRAARATFALDATVGADATLVAWPDPVACFAGASFDQTQRYALARDANLVVVDAWSAGRVARGERWAFERLAMRLAIAIDGEPVLDDALLLLGAHGDLAKRLGDHDAFATIALAGPRLVATCDLLAAAVASRPLASPLVTASRWPWGLVARIAARSTEALARATRELLGGCTRDLLGADPCARKW
jgi:urease accessory protein